MYTTYPSYIVFSRPAYPISSEYCEFDESLDMAHEFDREPKRRQRNRNLAALGGQLS
jgi:hypothetical protein